MLSAISRNTSPEKTTPVLIAGPPGLTVSGVA